jgi:hypothetical protein
MNIVKVPQREPQEFDHNISTHGRGRKFGFICYEHTVTAEQEGEFEWWFPYSDGSGNHTFIHSATLTFDKVVLHPSQITLFLQSPDEQCRVVIHKFEAFDLTPQRVTHEAWIVPNMSRGVLRVDRAQEGMNIHAAYIVERFF